MKSVTATLEGGQIYFFIVEGNPALLKAKKSSNSKTITKIPLGTFFVSDYVIPDSDPRIGDTKTQKWIHVKYVKKGKVYKGYISVKSIPAKNPFFNTKEDGSNEQRTIDGSST